MSRERREIETPFGLLILEQPTKEAIDWAVKAIQEKEQRDGEITFEE